MPYILLAKAAVGYHPFNGHETGFRSHPLGRVPKPVRAVPVVPNECCSTVVTRAVAVTGHWVSGGQGGPSGVVSKPCRADSEFRLASSLPCP
jgi:hypothetical protein